MLLPKQHFEAHGSLLRLRWLQETPALLMQSSLHATLVQAPPVYKAQKLHLAQTPQHFQPGTMPRDEDLLLGSKHLTLERQDSICASCHLWPVVFLQFHWSCNNHPTTVLVNYYCRWFLDINGASRCFSLAAGLWLVVWSLNSFHHQFNWPSP